MKLPNRQHMKLPILCTAAVLVSLLFSGSASAQDAVDDCLKKMSVRISQIMEMNNEQQIFVRSVAGSGRDDVVKRRLETQLQKVKLEVGDTGWGIVTNCQVELDGGDVVVLMKLQLRDRGGRAKGTLTGFVEISREEWFALQ